jgi:hypothetical protein
VPLEEKKAFLEGKLTEEEIAEVFKRLDQNTPSIPSSPKPSPISTQRLESTNSHFMTAVNVASLAVITTVGVNYLLDKSREKADVALRNELKERVHDTMKEQ